jgi:hypothetical protein
MLTNKNKNSNDMKNKIEEICNKLNREQLSVFGATEELLILFSVSKQSEPFINFAKEVIEYYEQHDIGDEDIYNKAKKLINGG